MTLTTIVNTAKIYEQLKVRMERTSPMTPKHQSYIPRQETGQRRKKREKAGKIQPALMS